MQQREDQWYGGKCTNRVIASKHLDQGGHALRNSDDRCIEQLFEAIPLRPEDVFADVGCREGRVLTYHDRHGFYGRLIDKRPGPLARQGDAHTPGTISPPQSMNTTVE